METRRFGRTGHQSTVAIFGAAAFWETKQEQADRVMELVIQAGVNHIDVAPSYGDAELRVGPWMKHERGRFFLGCKTMERTREGAWSELHRSLERLHTDAFDLYQCHAITTMEELDSLFVKGGVMEAMVAGARAGSDEVPRHHRSRRGRAAHLHGSPAPLRFRLRSCSR